MKEKRGQTEEIRGASKHNARTWIRRRITILANRLEEMRSGSVLHRFGLSSAGNVAIFFAAAMVPIMFAGGIAVDISRTLIVKQQLGQALDSVALSIGDRPGLTDQQKNDLAAAFIAANYPDSFMGMIDNVQVQTTDTTVTATGHATVEATFLKMFGYTSLTVAEAAQVVRE